MNAARDPSSTTATEDAPDEVDLHPWSRRRQEAGVIVWSSFLAACLASLICFAFIDPAQLAEDAHPPWWLPNAMTGYAIGFFFFWMVCAVAASLAAYLLETLPPNSPNNLPQSDKSSGNRSGS